MTSVQKEVAGIFEEYGRLQNRLETLEDQLAHVQAQSMGTGQSMTVERVKQSSRMDRMAESMIRSESLQQQIKAVQQQLGEQYQLIQLALYSIEEPYRQIITRQFDWDDLVPEAVTESGYLKSVNTEIELDLEETSEVDEAAEQEAAYIAFWQAWNEPSYSPFIIAAILQQLKAALKGKPNARQEIENITGMSSFRINRMIRFLKLIPVLRQMVEEGRIPIRTGWELSSLPEEKQMQLAEMMADNPDLRISKTLIQSMKRG